jgi:hypothetical protein
VSTLLWFSFINSSKLKMQAARPSKRWLPFTKHKLNVLNLRPAIHPAQCCPPGLPHSATDQYDAIVGRLKVINRITSEQNLFRCHFVHHESHIKSPEMNRSLRDEKSASNQLTQTRACTHTHLHAEDYILLSCRYVTSASGQEFTVITKQTTRW